jgi:anti-sigma factor RsiW
MNLQTATIEKVCSERSEIAAYIDGELSPGEEFELEMHLAICKSCGDELNEQKKLLRALSYALESEKEIELPADFTRTIVVNAESKVSGLRRPQERFRALFVCAALFLLVILGLGAETKSVFDASAKFADQMIAVGSFLWNLVYDVAIGAAIVLRSLSHQIVFNSSASFAFVIGFFFVLLIVLSRYIARPSRL